VDKQYSIGIDFGSNHIGLALVCHSDGSNQPKFAGTLHYSPAQLKKKLSPRPQLRRIRRSRKSKHSRLKRLSNALRALNLDESQINKMVIFCRRRGWKSLFGESKIEDNQDSDELVFRYFREDFFLALENEIQSFIPPDKQSKVISICERILNRPGNPHNEVRKLRIDNRGVSRCAWKDCQQITPRRHNAIKDALAQFVYLIIDIEQVRTDDSLKDKIDAALDHLEELGKRLCSAKVANHPPERHDAIKAERKVLLKKIRQESALIKELANPDTWSTNYANIKNILENSGGRNRYCRHHSNEFVNFQLAGKAIPFKNTLLDRDLISRREQVLFQRIWRYIEARLLPLADAPITRLVVERVAIDLLAGSWKQIQKTGAATLEDMYQNGPRKGFSSTLVMLKEEFGGLCAYCGIEHTSILEREHILPKADFVFDSYLNLVPSCPECNRQLKGGRALTAARLTIHADAYDAYQKYLASKFRNKPLHHLHAIKKGILKLMTEEKRTWEAEQYLALVAKNFSETTGSQRSPRPLARYLSEKLKSKFGVFPKIDFIAGRHTSLWRQVAFPEFDKAEDKTGDNSINHGLDAIILACKLPKPNLLEGANLPVRHIKSWVESVKKAAPEPGDKGIPTIPSVEFVVPGFEDVYQGNYISVDMAKFNWNRRDSSVQRQGIFGWNEHVNMPTMRKAASALAAELIEADKSETKINKIINNILHPQLKVALTECWEKEQTGIACANALTEWTRKSIGGSIKTASFSNHPADQSRKQLLQDFADKKTDSIPVTIGIKTFRPSDTKAVNLFRVNSGNHIIHRYRSDPGVVAKIAAYPKNCAHVDRRKLIDFDWRHNWAVIPKKSRIPQPDDDILLGRAYGQPIPDERLWLKALETYFTNIGIVEYAFVRQGCVAVYEDETQQFIRNFSSTQGFKTKFLKGIIGIKRTPFIDKITMNRVIDRRITPAL